MIDVQSMQDSVSANALAYKRPCAKIWHHYCAMDSLQERLIMARKAAKLSQAALAKLAKCGQTTIASIENGRNHSSSVLARVAAILNVEPLWLAEGKGPQRRDWPSPTPVGALHLAEPEPRESIPHGYDRRSALSLTKDETSLVEAYRIAEASTRRTMLLLANDVLKNLGKRLANHG